MFSRLSKTQKLNSMTVLIAGILVGITYLLFLKWNQITPFGNATWIMYDLKRQYADYFGYYQSVLHGENHVFYSFSTALGSGTLGLFTYYLSSPFLLVFALLNKTRFPLGISFIIGLKLVFAAMIMTGFLLWYLKKEAETTEEKQNKETNNGEFSGEDKLRCWKNICALFGGFTWSYSGFLVAHSMNMMWMDVIICLPIMIYCLETLLETGKKRWYVTTLCLMLWCNYYITFQVLLFIGLWTLYRSIGAWIDDRKARKSSDKHVVIAKIVNVIYATFLAVGLEAIILLPTFLSLFNSPKDIGKEGLELTGKNLSLLELLSKLPTLAYDEIQPRFGLPQLYCGILTLILVCFFMVNRRISIKERVGMFVLLGIMMLSMAVDLLNLIWHAGMEPSGHPYRQAFLFVFLMILCACKALYRLEDGINYIGMILANVIVVGIIFIAVHAGQPYDTPYMQKLNYVLLLLQLGLFDMFLILRFKEAGEKKSWTRQAIVIVGIVLFMVQSYELFQNDAYTYSKIALYSAKADEFAFQVASAGAEVDAVKNSDTSFYRMENYNPRQQNDGMMHGFNGVTHYSSAGLMYVRDFLDAIGYNDDGLYSNYGKDNTVTADCILGIKYLVGVDDEHTRHSYKSWKNNETYENPYFYGVAAISKGEIHSLKSSNPFENQNQIVSDLMGERMEMFSPVSLSQTEETKMEENPEHYVSYLATCNKAGDVYFYLDGIGDLSQNLAVFVDGQFVTGYGNLACYKVLHLGTFEENDEFVLTVTGEDNSNFGTTIVVTEDDGKLQYLQDALNSRGRIDISSPSSRKIYFDIPCDGGIMTTIPYEKGWRIYVDSKRVEPEIAYGTFIYLPKQVGGAHVELIYAPEGIYLGSFISILAMVWLLCGVSIKNRQKKTIS